PFSENLDMVPVFLQNLDDLPCRCGVIAGWIWVTGKTQVDGFPFDMIFLKLRPRCLHNLLTRLDIRMELLPVTMQDARCKAVIASVWASGIDIQRIVAVLFRFPFWFINRLHSI